MTLFPSTPRQLRQQASQEQLQQSAPQNVRKVSSLLDLRKRVVPATVGRPWKMNDQAATGSGGTIGSSTSNTGSLASNGSSNAWTKLVNAASGHLGQAGPQDSTPLTPTSIAPSTVSREASMESVGLSAYLRMRPRPTATESPAGNIQIISDTEAAMSSASSESTFTMPRSSSIASLSLGGLPPPSTHYSFTEVFPESTDQAAIYRSTTLPLVKNLLGASDSGRMDNALVFAYGVSGGGKTHTVQGSSSGEPGIIPRALDTIMNSVHGNQTASYLRPCRLTGLELTPKQERISPGLQSNLTFDAATVRKTMLSGEVAEIMKRDATTLTLPDAYEYSIWASYAEVYNEKIYDLFDVSDKRKALSLKTDRQASNKYIHGLREVRIWSNEDAQAVLQKGQINRHVFSTRLNGVSSRSHSIFTIKVVRLAKGVDPENAGAFANVSRLSIVDLAGSERYKNTETKGDRLKEAGNINKSLMVLGQCMEVMRKNQEERSKGRKPAMVPFRHSKLTELFQSYFCGDGKAVMIAAINAYQTSYEENLNVLRFSAIATQVATVQTLNRAPSSHAIAQAAVPRYQQPLRPSNFRQAPSARTLPILPALHEDDTRPEDMSHEQHEDIAEDVDHSALGDSAIEDDDDADYASSSEDDQDAFVDALLDEIRLLRKRIVQLEMDREVDLQLAKQEGRDEAEEEIDGMERAFAIRLAQETARQELKTDRKIDILVRTHNAQIERIMAEQAKEGDLNEIVEEGLGLAEEPEVTNTSQDEGRAHSSAMLEDGHHRTAKPGLPLSRLAAQKQPEASQTRRRSLRKSTSDKAPSLKSSEPKRRTSRTSKALSDGESGSNSEIDENTFDESGVLQTSRTKAAPVKKIKLRTKGGMDADALSALPVQVGTLTASGRPAAQSRNGSRRMV